MRLSVGVVLLLALSACGDKGSDPPPPPDPSDLVLTGRVQLEGNMFTLSGDSLGVRRVEDADGVRVQLVCPGPGDHGATTTDGAYEFDLGADAPDDSCSVFGLVGEEVAALTRRFFLDRDLENPHTLTIRPYGEMRISPNPFTQDHGAGAEWIAEARDLYTFEVYRLDGALVYSFGDTVLAGFNHFHWGGVDQSNTPVGPGMYWYVIRRRNDVRWNLAFME